MTQFDRLLRQGLMDANLAQYESVLRQADSVQPDFSTRYLRERMRMLANPWKWAKRRPALGRGLSRGVAVAIAILLLATVAAAVTAPFWMSFFGGLDQRQQEIVGDMEIGGEEAGSLLLPPPVEHDGVTITPLRLLGAKNRMYLALEIRGPEGTVFRPEDEYQLFGGPYLPPEQRTQMEAISGRFTVLEAGTREPNVLVGVAEATASFDLGGSIYRIRALYRFTPEGASETVFQASDPVGFQTGTWDIPIPEGLNEEQLLELPVKGLSMTEDGRTMTLLSMSVSPLGVWWKYRLEGEDPWPWVRIALRMRDGSEVEAAPGQLTMGDMGAGCTATVEFEKPVDLHQAEAMLWGHVEIPLEVPSD